MTSYFCAYCGAEIPADAIARRKRTPTTMPKRVYCNNEHRNRDMQRSGEYKAMSLKGREGRITFLKQAKPKRKPNEQTNRKISTSLKRRYSEKGGG